MAENTKTDELRDQVEAIIIVDDYVHGIKISTLDKIMQLINSEVHQALDTIQTSSDKGMYIGERAADVLANHRKVIDESIEAERNKYPLNKEES